MSESPKKIQSSLSVGGITVDQTSHQETSSTTTKVQTKEIYSKKVEEAHSSENRNEFEGSDTSMQVKKLFNPKNPARPIYVANTRNVEHSSNVKIASNVDPVNILKKDKDNNYAEKKEPDAHKKDREAKKINEVKNILIKIESTEKTLTKLINEFRTNRCRQDFFDQVNSLRKNLDECLILAFLVHIETASNLNIDTRYWRACYHQLIETLRKELPTVKNDGMKQKLSEYLTTVLKEGIAFYSGFVDIIEEKFLDFKATHFIDINYYDRCIDLLRKNPATNTVTTIRTKETKYALNLINRCWLSLGDLERYLLTTTCIQSETSYDGSKSNLDYSVSRNYYLKATGLMPKSSRAYHQLAVLAMYTKKPLEACYYYFRCLEVTIPLDGVRQSLNALFAEQESRLKSQLKNKMAKKFTNRIGPDKEIEHKKKTTPSSRVELWFNPSFNTNNTNKVDEDIDKDDDLDKESTSSFSSSLSDSDDEDAQVASIQKSFRGIFSSKIKKSSNELKKCFTLNYLNAIGRLFTKVGMETYPEICRNALKQFNLLINQQPCVLSKQRILQIMVINVTIIQLSSSDRFQLEQSIQFGLDMFCMIVKRFNRILKNMKISQISLDKTIKLNENMSEVMSLCPSIKVFIDWMRINIDTWTNVAEKMSPSYFPESVNLNFWELIISMFNLVSDRLSKFDISTVNQSFYRIKLEEDLELAGFAPFFELPREEYEYQNELKIQINYLETLNEEMIANFNNFKRFEKIILFADYLCSLNKLQFNIDKGRKRYVLSQISTTTTINPNKISELSEVIENEKKFNSYLSESQQNDERIKGENNPGGNGDEVHELIEKRRLLKEKIEENEKRKQDSLSIIEKHITQRIEIEIRPKFIIPDTNCFIDHLDLMVNILKTKYYTTVIPLIVINEIDKLTKINIELSDECAEHAVSVKKNAFIAMNFLNSEFEKKNHNLKAMTSHGTLLETIQFRSEEIIKKGSNDELILGCCLYYCKDKETSESKNVPKNQNDILHIYREVVLLTGDRHLCMKAPRLDSGYASKPTNLASGACGYLQGITVQF